MLFVFFRSIVKCILDDYISMKLSVVYCSHKALKNSGKKKKATESVTLYGLIHHTVAIVATDFGKNVLIARQIFS